MRNRWVFSTILQENHSTNEQRIILKHFGNKSTSSWRKGIYVELGALDGVTFSNTKAFEAAFNYTGVLIEADPRTAPKLNITRSRNININSAICSNQGEMHYVYKSAVGGIWELMADSFKKRWHPDLYAHPEQVDTLPKVQCMPLRDIFAALKLDRVDFFSLDVEGGELSVLETIDFTKITFDIIIVEQDMHNPTKNYDVAQLLVKNKYYMIERIGSNDVFAHTSHFKEKD